MAGKDIPRKKREEDLVRLYDGYYDKIAYYIFIRIGDRAEAEDLASEVFLKALKSLDSYEERGLPMHSWLFRIAHNLVVDHLRKVSKQRTVSLDTVEIPDTDDPEEATEYHLKMEKLAVTLKHLSPPERELINLRFFAELSSAEVGEILGKSPQAVRQMQFRALRSLRKMLDKEGYK